MSDMNWDLAPEGANKLGMSGADGVLRWKSDNGKCWYGKEWKLPYSVYKTIATRPQPERKTVEDAVEWANGVWSGPDCNAIAYNPTSESFCYYDSLIGLSEKWYYVCTYEEFKACVAAKSDKSEPEWTHTINGVRCEILTDKVDSTGFIIVENEVDGYTICRMSELKPIKPTITKVEAWDMMADYCGALSLEEFFHELQTEYKITN